MIGGGTDGASVNVSEQNGMMGKLQQVCPWMFWAWCFAHRLELACKDALSSQLFKDIDDMLFRLYYLYSKSPKKSRKLSDIVDLKEVFEFPKGGNLPVRSQGSRWINHKRKALQRFVDRYGAYIHHLLTLVEDKTIKSDDRAKLKGYLQKWRHTRMLVGAALYVDVLKSPSYLSLCLQDDHLDIISGIKSVLKSSKSLKSMAEQDPLQWQVPKLVCSRVKNEGEDKIYQGAVLQGYSAYVLSQCADIALKDLQELATQIRSRLEWSDVQLLRSALAFLDTQSWCCSQADTDEDDMASIKSAVEYLSSHFREPLEAAGVSLASIQDEIEEAVDYARNYLRIGSESYQKIWYRLHTATDVEKWRNILTLSDLVFSLPFSNGQVERMFSMMKIIKTDRTSLHTSTLSDLLEIQVEGPPLAKFSPDRAVKLWWDDCKTTRRVNQAPRKEYRPRTTSTESSSCGPSSSEASSDSTEEALSLDDWDDLFDSD